MESCTTMIELLDTMMKTAFADVGKIYEICIKNHVR